MVFTGPPQEGRAGSPEPRRVSTTPLAPGDTSPKPAGGPSPSSRRTAPWALFRLGVALAVIVAVFLLAGLGALLLFIVALVVFVVLHELGHFLTAKWSRMKVTEFFIGFGPRLWSHRFGETDYGVKPILIGAYVKIPGMSALEEIDPADEARTYRQKPFHRRILVASAGSIMHYVIAFLLALVLALSIGVPTSTKVSVGGFSKWAGHAETAAQLAGMKKGDTIVSVAGKKLTTITQLSAAIDASKGRAVRVVVERAGRLSTLVVHPQAGHVVTKGKTATKEVLGPGPGKTRWLIGITLEDTPVYTAKSPWDAVAWAADDVGSITRLTVLGVGRAFSPGALTSLYHQVTNSQAGARAAANPASNDRLSSVVGIGRLATQAEAAGPYEFISVLILLNIAFGLFNMFPMLPLDGGHVVIALYERLRTRRGRRYYQADITKLMPVVYAFVAILVVLVGSAFFLDIAHPIANPFG